MAEGKGEAPPKVAASAELQDQLKIQDEVAQRMQGGPIQERSAGHRLDGDHADDVERPGHRHATMLKNRATELIEDFMIAANEVMRADC